VGQQATSANQAIVLQNVNNLHTEADVSEADVANLQVGQSIDYTFDAFGPDKHFSGTILTINPASTVISGVVDYKVKGSLGQTPKIKPGMTANMTILVNQKKGVLVVPSSALVIDNSGRQYVRVVDSEKVNSYHQVLVQTGVQADGGLVEVLSGVSEGQKIVTYVAQ